MPRQDRQIATEKQTLVEEGTRFEGSFSSEGPIVVKGTIQGRVTAPSLRISETGVVQGKVKVGELVSQGELSGEVDADLVHLSGIVRDKTIVRARSLEVKLAAPGGRMEIVFGASSLEADDAPSNEVAANSSLTAGASIAR